MQSIKLGFLCLTDYQLAEDLTELLTAGEFLDQVVKEALYNTVTSPVLVKRNPTETEIMLRVEDVIFKLESKDVLLGYVLV